jgi:hypothetical protein
VRTQRNPLLRRYELVESSTKRVLDRADMTRSEAVQKNNTLRTKHFTRRIDTSMQWIVAPTQEPKQ